jgi:hypothetical protein
MSSLYTGNPAGGARSPAIQITGPADLDPLNAASVNALALSKLADYVAWLQAHAAVLDQANTLSALLSLANDVNLTAAVAQAILKTAAGGLTFGTAAGGGDLTLSANGVALLKLLASGSLDAQGKALGNLGVVTAAAGVTGLPTPSAATDATSKVYVDGKFLNTAWAAMPFNAANWTNGAGAAAVYYCRDAAGNVRFRGRLTSAGTASVWLNNSSPLPTGFRPGVTTTVNHVGGIANDLLSVDTSGNISLGISPTLGDYVYLANLSYLGEN